MHIRHICRRIARSILLYLEMIIIIVEIAQVPKISISTRNKTKFIFCCFACTLYIVLVHIAFMSSEAYTRDSSNKQATNIIIALIITCRSTINHICINIEHIHCSPSERERRYYTRFVMRQFCDTHHNSMNGSKWLRVFNKLIGSTLNGMVQVKLF